MLSPYTAANQALARERSIFNQVYLWMTAGLLVTGVVAALVASSPVLVSLVYSNPLLFIGLLLVQIVLVVTLSAGIMRLSIGLALTLFLVYAALNGLSIAGIFLAYTKASLASTFLVTAGTFAVMSIYGFTTKRDLTAVRNIAFMALIGLLLASIVNIFLRNPLLYWLITYAGVLIFVALTAADTRKIKLMISSASGDQARRLAILGALTLYLDFINLFLFLLRIFGRSSSD